MVTLNVVQRLRHGNDLRSYRRKLSGEIHQSAMVRLLPALLDVPLPIVGTDTAPRHLDDTLEQAGYVVLAGTNGSGRSLALHQLARRWLADDDAPIPAVLSLPRIDDGRSQPLALLADTLEKASPNGRSRRDTPVGPLAERLAGWVLLISGLDELPEQRQTAWRTLLKSAPEQWTETRVVVTAPRDEARWAGFAHLTIAQPEHELVERWITILAPVECRAPITVALRPDGPLATLGERLFEVALLALVAARAPLPAGRAALYDAALAAIFDLDRQHEAGRAALESLQLLAAYDERPASLRTGLVEAAGTGQLRFYHPLFRSFLAARQLVAENRYEPLTMVDAGERLELARFCASVATNLAPLYTVLWGSGKPDADTLLALGTCLRERPDSPPSWTLKIIGALAVLARDGRPTQRTLVSVLLRQNRVALDRAFAALKHAEHKGQRFILQMLQLLPADLALGYAEQMAYDTASDAPFGWDLADLLVNRPPLTMPSATPPDDTGARARWTYVQALRGPDYRATLARVLPASAIQQLAETGLDEARLLRVAAVLVDDPHLPTEYRVAGLSLLAENTQPTALTVIERACYDTDALVRQTALVQLAARDANRGQAALSRAALDQEAPNDTRIGAVEQIVRRFAEESQPMLARCAGDITLPLYARLLCVGALGPAAYGTLAGILRDEAEQPDVRAFAGGRLASSGEVTYLALLLGLLDNQASPSEVVQSICANLSPSDEALEPLLRLLARSNADTELTIAAIGALGRLKAEAVVQSLGALVGDEALERLQHVVPPHLRELTTAEVLESDELPAPMALALTTSVARAESPAEQPTTLREFLNDQADSIRRAAADALATIEGNAARAALLAALLDDSCGTASDHVVGALARSGEHSAEALSHLLTSSDVNPMIRWKVVQHLRHHRLGEATMHRALALPGLDSFTRGALAEALGECGAITALPLLRQLADDQANDAHLRSQAIIGLGLLNEPATEIVLIRLLADATEEPALRGLAAEHLPTHLSVEGRRLLRDLLRRERQPDPLTAGALSVLGRVQDREALPLLLRFAQDERADVARAALGALAELGDGSVAPVLVRVAQNPAADRSTRLRAIGTLLKIGGDGYRPLLRTYLEDGPLPLRLQALDHLIAASTSGDEVIALLGIPALPLPLRLRVLSACRERIDAVSTLTAIAARESEHVQLRVRAVQALQHCFDSSTADVLIALAANAPDPVRIACITTLGTIGGTSACTALSNLAEGSSQPPVIRACARHALRQATERVEHDRVQLTPVAADAAPTSATTVPHTS